MDKAKAMLQRVRERQWNKKNKHRVPATYQEGDWVLVHHSRLPAWTRSTSNDPYFGPYKILSVDGHCITMRCSPRLGGTLVCAVQHLKGYYDPEDLCGEESELNEEEIAALDLQGAASPMEVEGDLPDMNAEDMAQRENVIKTWARLVCDSKSFHAKRTFKLIKHIYLWLENPKRKLTQFLREVQHEQKII